MLRSVVRHSAGRAAAVFLAGALSAAAAVAAPAVLGRTVDLLLSPQAGRPAGPWLLLSAVLIGAEVFLDAGVALLGGNTGARSTAWLRRGAYARLLAAEPRHAAAFAPGDLATRLTVNAADTGTAPVTLAGACASLLPPLGGLVGLFLVDAWTAVAFVAGIPVLLLVLRAFTRGSTDATARYQRVQSLIADRLTEAMAGARTITAAGTERREQERVLAPLAGLGVEGRRTWRVYGRAVSHAGMLMPLLTTVVLAVGGVRLAGGHLSPGDLLAASRYATLAAGIGTLTGALNALVRSRVAASRVGALLELSAVAYGDATLPQEGPGTVELRGVGVVRAGATVLDDVSLVIPGGSVVAVVGRSGSGKSTLAAVAGRLTDPDRGRVLLDGVPLDALDAGVLRRAVGYAFERPALFGQDVGDAIAFGAHRPADEAVRSAAGAADADGFVALLPDGYATPLAEAPLSGGETQRLGLARAFAHAGRLLILDDATSSLDTVTERRVTRALHHEVRAGTRLIVAHRPSSCTGADLVVWLEDGRVRGTGLHQELWRDAGYRAVFAAEGDGSVDSV
ncbi:ABC transporter ATP-binding protein [Streptomyces tsukubensis]|uniref:ABC transporter ATP-binding protein n=1 Tax=Streptomyces tsukubensis TaxID=83656 RepID=A0A1V4AA67_9ACTN|nr:ABC transporter ATP-binding protein [Streptomyces tsukubensis]